MQHHNVIWIQVKRTVIYRGNHDRLWNIVLIFLLSLHSKLPACFRDSKSLYLFRDLSVFPKIFLQMSHFLHRAQAFHWTIYLWVHKHPIIIFFFLTNFKFILYYILASWRGSNFVLIAIFKMFILIDPRLCFS